MAAPRVLAIVLAGGEGKRLMPLTAGEDDGQDVGRCHGSTLGPRGRRDQMARRDAVTSPAGVDLLGAGRGSGQVRRRGRGPLRLTCYSPDLQPNLPELSYSSPPGVVVAAVCDESEVVEVVVSRLG